MTTLVLTDPVNGTVADANTIASNNTATKAVVNGNIDNANVASAAAIAATKLAAGGSGQVLGMLAGVPTWLGGFGKIFDSTLGSAQATFDITSIPTTYAHLLLILNGRGDTAAGSTTVGMRCNGDSGANYDRGRIFYDGGTTITGAQSAGQTSNEITNNMAANTSTAGDASLVLVFMPGYAGTTFKKTALALAANKTLDGANNNEIGIYSISWLSTSAINQLTLIPGAGNFNTGSRCTLYGMGV